MDLGNTDILTIGPGEVIHVTCGGAGGWGGDPFRRDPDAVLLDWRRGWVSTEHAREAYGVVIAEEGAVDVPATEALRAARAARALARVVRVRRATDFTTWGPSGRPSRPSGRTPTTMP